MLKANYKRRWHFCGCWQTTYARGELNQQTVVATVMSNVVLSLPEIARDQFFRTDVGDKYVLEELLRSGANIGREQSGHIIFETESLAGDGLITTLCVCE